MFVFVCITVPSPNDDQVEDEDGDITVSATKDVVEKESTSLPALETGDNNNNNTNNNINNNNLSQTSAVTSMIETSNNIPRTILSIPIGNSNDNDGDDEIIDLTGDSPPNIKFSISSSKVNIEQDYVQSLYNLYPVLQHLLIWKQELVISIMKQNPTLKVKDVIRDVVNMDDDSGRNMKNDNWDIKYIKTDKNVTSKQRNTNKNKNRNKSNQLQQMQNVGNGLNQLQQINVEHRAQPPAPPPPPPPQYLDDLFLGGAESTDHTSSQQLQAPLTEQEEDEIFFKLSGLRRDRSIAGYDDDEKDNDYNYKQTKTRNTNLTGAELEQQRYSVQLYYYLQHPDRLDTDLQLNSFVFDQHTPLSESIPSLYDEMIHHSQNYPSLTVEDWANVKRFINIYNPSTSSGYKFINEPWLYLQKQLAVEKELLFHDPGTYIALKHASLNPSDTNTNTMREKQRRRTSSSSSTTTKKGKGRRRRSGKGRGTISSRSSRTSSTIPATPDTFVLPFENDMTPIKHLLIAPTKILEIRYKSPDSAQPRKEGEWNDNWLRTCAALDRGDDATPLMICEALKEISLVETQYIDLLLRRIKNRIYIDVRIPELMKMTDAKEREAYFVEIHNDGEKRLSSISHTVDNMKDSIRCAFATGPIRDEFRARGRSLDDNWKRLLFVFICVCLFSFVFAFVFIFFAAKNRDCNMEGLILLQRLALLFVVDPETYPHFKDDCIYPTICNRTLFHGKKATAHGIIACSLNHENRFTNRGGFTLNSSKGNNVWKTHLEHCNVPWQNKTKNITRTIAKLKSYKELMEDIYHDPASYYNDSTLNDILNSYNYIMKKNGFKIKYIDLAKFVLETEANKLAMNEKYRESRILSTKSSKYASSAMDFNINTIIQEIDDDSTESENNYDEDDDDDDDLKMTETENQEPRQYHDKEEMDAYDDDDDINVPTKPIPPLPEHSTSHQHPSKKRKKKKKKKKKSKSQTNRNNVSDNNNNQS